jgi:hypothetical protein
MLLFFPRERSFWVVYMGVTWRVWAYTDVFFSLIQWVMERTGLWKGTFHVFGTGKSGCTLVSIPILKIEMEDISIASEKHEGCAAISVWDMKPYGCYEEESVA